MKNQPAGITLIEIVISVALLSGAIAIFGALLQAVKLNKTETLYSAAYKIAQDEIASVRAMPNSALTARASSTFVGVLYDSGAYGAVATGTALSAPNVLQNQATTSSLGVVLLPYDNLQDFTLEASVRAAATAQKTGLLFRAADTANYYFLHLKSGQLVLEKNLNGALSNIATSAQTFTADAWYKLKIVASGANFSIYLNDNLIGAYSDSSFASGAAALANENNTALFDDISLTRDGSTELWNFDNLAAGNIPMEWRRTSLSDLPSGAGYLTIIDPYGDAALKKITVTVNWKERGLLKSVTLMTLKTE
jgi:hypothetical protein